MVLILTFRRFAPGRSTPRRAFFCLNIISKLKSMPPRLQRAPARLSYMSAAEAEAARSRLRDDTHKYRAWYRTSRWRKLRLQVLQRDGYICRQTGVALIGLHPAPDSPVVDHIRPHRGSAALFWDASNLQAVSKAWHDSAKQRLERSGRV